MDERIESLLVVLSLFVIIGLFMIAIFLHGWDLGPSFKSYRCNKHCNESYAGKSTSGFFNSWVHTYKCENSTLYEEVSSGNYCLDEDGFGEQCKVFECILREGG